MNLGPPCIAGFICLQQVLSVQVLAVSNAEYVISCADFAEAAAQLGKPG